MEAPTGLHKLRGPSPIVWAMRTRVAPPPQLAEPISRPVYPPPPPPQDPLPPVTERRRRGRPRKCDSLAPPPGFAPLPAASRPAPAAPAPAPGKGKLDGLQPHVLAIAAGESFGDANAHSVRRALSIDYLDSVMPLNGGEILAKRLECASDRNDIISKVMAVSQLTSKAVCILSALGAVKEAFLLQPSGVILNHKGPLEIIRLSGSILTSSDHRSLRVTLASANSFVISGVIAGPLRAATPVQAILGSFHDAAFRPNNTPGAATTSIPNPQGTVRNGSTLPSELSNPQAAPCASVEQNGSNEILVSFQNAASWPNNAFTSHPNTQGTVGNGGAPACERSNPESTSCTYGEQNGSNEIDVKPSLEILSRGYAACSSAQRNGSNEIDVKPFLGVNNPISGLYASSGDTEVHGLDSSASVVTMQ